MVVEKLTYSINEAASALGIGRTKIYHLISDGKITPVKIGKRTLIKADSLKEFVSQLPELA